MSDKTYGVLILAAMVIYFISPVDLVPGPVDDLIVIVAGAIAARKKFKHVE